MINHSNSFQKKKKKTFHHSVQVFQFVRSLSLLKNIQLGFFTIIIEQWDFRMRPHSCNHTVKGERRAGGWKYGERSMTFTYLQEKSSKKRIFKKDP